MGKGKKDKIGKKFYAYACITMKSGKRIYVEECYWEIKKKMNDERKDIEVTIAKFIGEKITILKSDISNYKEIF